jgi:hypothetical protein
MLHSVCSPCGSYRAFLIRELAALLQQAAEGGLLLQLLKLQLGEPKLLHLRCSGYPNGALLLLLLLLALLSYDRAAAGQQQQQGGSMTTICCLSTGMMTVMQQEIVQ